MTTLLVASSGGHLAQLHHLRRALALGDEPVIWVTYEGEQGRSVLDGEAVEYLPWVGSRDLRGVLRNVPAANRILRRHNPSQIVTTGAQIAVSFIGPAALQRIPLHFIESVSRTDKPSLSASIARRFPGTVYYVQHSHMAGSGSLYRGSVFDCFATQPSSVPVTSISSAVVTVGTFQTYGFSRLLDHMRSVLPDTARVSWQTGPNPTDGLHGHVRAWFAADELVALQEKTDVVVAHAGAGSALTALLCGKCPVLVPRRGKNGEAVDDHQVALAQALAEQGLAVVSESPTYADLLTAANLRVSEASEMPEFRLHQAKPHRPVRKTPAHRGADVA